MAKKDVEKILAERKRIENLSDPLAVQDALMLHFIMGILYSRMEQLHSFRDDWGPNLDLSAKTYVNRCSPEEKRQVAEQAVQQAQVIFEPVFRQMGDTKLVDVRSLVLAFAQVVLKLVDQNRYRFADDALVLQSLGMWHEAVEVGSSDWEYRKQEVDSLYSYFMRAIDRSSCFRTEGELNSLVLN